MPLTFAQIENPADIVAEAFKTVVEADSPTFPLAAYANRAFEEMGVNRVEIAAGAFSRASDHMNFGTSGTPYYDHRRGTLAVTVVTARNDQQTTDAHAYAIGRIRYLLSRYAQLMTPTALSGFVLLDILDNGESTSEDEKTDTDRTLLTFEVQLVIPSSVFDAAS